MFRSFAKKDSPSLDNICYLISNKIKQDENGNEIADGTEVMVFCAEVGVYSSEFFNAGIIDIKAEVLLLIDFDNYEGQKIVKYNNAKYSVYRVFPRTDGFMELYLTEKVGV